MRTVCQSKIADNDVRLAMLLVQQQVRLNRAVLALIRSDRCQALHF